MTSRQSAHGPEPGGIFQTFCANEDGATAIEYGLIAALIFLAIVTAVNSYSDSASDMYNRLSSAIDAAGS